MTEFDKLSHHTEINSTPFETFKTIEPETELSRDALTELVRSEFDKSKKALIEEIYGRSEDEIGIDYSLSEQVLDLLDRFELDNWDALNDTEKIDLVKSLIETFSTELCLPEIPYLFLVEREDGYYGSYVPGLNTIVINENGFSDPKELVDTIAHELRHAYQYYRAEKNGTPEDALFRANFENYISPEYDSQGSCINFADYYSQYVEADARAFANKVTEAME